MADCQGAGVPTRIVKISEATDLEDDPDDHGRRTTDVLHESLQGLLKSFRADRLGVVGSVEKHSRALHIEEARENLTRAHVDMRHLCRRRLSIGRSKRNFALLALGLI